MSDLKTNSIRHFQKRVYEAKSRGQKNVSLSLGEAELINHEMSQLLAILLEMQTSRNQEAVEISILGQKFDNDS